MSNKEMEALREYARELGKLVTTIQDFPTRMRIWDYGCKIDFLLNDLEAVLKEAEPVLRCENSDCEPIEIIRYTYTNEEPRTKTVCGNHNHGKFPADSAPTQAGGEAVTVAIYNPSRDVASSLRIANDYFNMTAPEFRKKYPQVKVNVREYVALIVSGALLQHEDATCVHDNYTWTYEGPDVCDNCGWQRHGDGEFKPPAVTLPGEDGGDEPTDG